LLLLSLLIIAEQKQTSINFGMGLWGRAKDKMRYLFAASRDETARPSVEMTIFLEEGKKKGRQLSPSPICIK
jgi:hypothetical protein